MRLLALHIPGKRNWGADGLSRDGVEGATVARCSSRRARRACELRPLELPEERETVFAEAAALPQSAKAGTKRGEEASALDAVRRGADSLHAAGGLRRG